MIKGNLHQRAILNKDRLLGELYSYPSVFQQPSTWPGDFPGRALLGLASLYFAFQGEEQVQSEIKRRIDCLLSHLKEFTNEDFYFGSKFDESILNEQQFAGNSWYIRGLCCVYEIERDPALLMMIRHIEESFLLKAAKVFKDYPVEKRSKEGGVAGHILKDASSNWMLSSDVGCAYILLDGFVSAYEILREKRLEKAIEEIVDAYERIDFVALKFQTHATLTSARALLRLYSLTKKERYLHLAKKAFDSYLEHGMTLDYENFNWFDRPETWTEPCCVIDSWILCKSFYDVYREERYLRLYNRIVTNGLRTFQRQNGGAGCSCCARSGAEEIHSFLYEAYFCCTMRLGEGMRHLFDVKREEKESVVFLLPTSYEDDSLSLSFEPYSSDILAIRSKKPFDLKLYVPRGFSLKGEVGEVKDSFLHLKLEPGEYAFPFVIGRHEENGLHFWGDLLLSKKGEEEEFTPLLDSSLYDEEGLKAIHQRLK